MPCRQQFTQHPYDLVNSTHISIHICVKDSLEHITIKRPQILSNFAPLFKIKGTHQFIDNILGLYDCFCFFFVIFFFYFFFCQLKAVNRPLVTHDNQFYWIRGGYICFPIRLNTITIHLKPSLFDLMSLNIVIGYLLIINVNYKSFTFLVIFIYKLFI